MGHCASKTDTLNKHYETDHLLEAFNGFEKDVTRDQRMEHILYNNQFPIHELERYKDALNWAYASQYQKLTVPFITKYRSRIDFNALSKSKYLTPDIMLEFIEDLNMNYMVNHARFTECVFLKMLPFLNTYHIITTLKRTRCSDDTLRAVILADSDCQIFEAIAQYQNLSEQFIDDMKDNLDWKLISHYQSMSDEFVKTHWESIVWEELSYNKNLSRSIVSDNRLKFKNTEEVDNALRKDRTYHL